MRANNQRIDVVTHNSLSNELLVIIFELLPNLADMLAVMQVSQRWRALTRDRSFIKKMLDRFFPSRQTPYAEATPEELFNVIRMVLLQFRSSSVDESEQRGWPAQMDQAWVLPYQPQNISWNQAFYDAHHLDFFLLNVATVTPRENLCPLFFQLISAYLVRMLVFQGDESINLLKLLNAAKQVRVLANYKFCSNELMCVAKNYSVANFKQSWTTLSALKLPKLSLQHLANEMVLRWARAGQVELTHFIFLTKTSLYSAAQVFQQVFKQALSDHLLEPRDFLLAPNLQAAVKKYITVFFKEAFSETLLSLFFTITNFALTNQFFTPQTLATLIVNGRNQVAAILQHIWHTENREYLPLAYSMTACIDSKQRRWRFVVCGDVDRRKPGILAYMIQYDANGRFSEFFYNAVMATRLSEEIIYSHSKYSLLWRALSDDAKRNPPNWFHAEVLLDKARTIGVDLLGCKFRFGRGEELLTILEFINQKLEQRGCRESELKKIREFITEYLSRQAAPYATLPSVGANASAFWNNTSFSAAAAVHQSQDTQPVSPPAEPANTQPGHTPRLSFSQS